MILCGTDLSAASDVALTCAAALARKLKQELLLAHIVERPGSAELVVAGDRIALDAERLTRELNVKVRTTVAGGVPERELAELAQTERASLIVVASQGGSQRSRRLGGVPERLCQMASVPVLVARSAEPFLRWSADQRPLQTMVGSGLGDASRSALGCVASWPDLALTVAHVAWPYAEHRRLGVEGPMPLDELRPEVHQQLLGDLGRWAADVPGSSPRTLHVMAGWGRIDSHLAQLGREKGTELLVVGSHQRNLAARVWHGSVARSVIHEASCNVLCVPERHAPASISASPRVVVIPTDLSALSDRAIATGYSLLLASGGSVQLVTVATRPSEQRKAELKAELESRIPADAVAHDIGTEVHVLDGDPAWEAIWQFASRASADVICMATRSRDAASALLLGSQTQGLLQHSRIPVVVVPPDRES